MERQALNLLRQYIPSLFFQAKTKAKTWLPGAIVSRRFFERPSPLFYRYPRPD